MQQDGLCKTYEFTGVNYVYRYTEARRNNYKPVTNISELFPYFALSVY